MRCSTRCKAPRKPRRWPLLPVGRTEGTRSELGACDGRSTRASSGYRLGRPRAIGGGRGVPHGVPLRSVGGGVRGSRTGFVVRLRFGGGGSRGGLRRRPVGVALAPRSRRRTEPRLNQGRLCALPLPPSCSSDVTGFISPQLPSQREPVPSPRPRPVPTGSLCGRDGANGDGGAASAGQATTAGRECGSKRNRCAGST